MLSDRSYMRSDPLRPAPGFLACFLGALAAGFVLQSVAEYFGSSFLFEHGALSAEGLRGGEVWTLFTYVFLHGGVFHLLLNGLGIFFLGRALQESLGQSQLAALTLVGTVGSALAWAGLHFNRTGAVIGASGVVMAYLAVFACLHPRRPMTLLLFFVIPVTVQPIWLVAVIAGVDVLGLLAQELPGRGSLYGVAHSAHLGGLAAGWLFHRFVLARPPSGGRAAVEPPSWVRKRAARPAPAYSVDLGPAPKPAAPHPLPAEGSAQAAAATRSREALRAEVDRILDKINLHGFGSLTDAEKRVLDEARQHLNPR